MHRSRDAVIVGRPIPSLVHWGRSADADLVYRTLVTFGPVTATDLERDLGLSRRRVVSALDELAAIDAVGFGPASTRRGQLWRATPPAQVFASLRRGQVSKPSPPPGGPRTAVEDLVHGQGLRHLRTRALTRARVAELNAVATHEHLAMNPEQAFTAEVARAAVPMDRMLLNRGVHMRVLGVQAARSDPLLPHGRRPTESTPDYREVATVPMKLIVVDRKVAFFPVDPDNFEHGYLEVAQAPVVSALVSLFERHWEAARDPWEWAVPQTALSPREYTLITLLANGHTDASAARELHISTRSVSNILRGLMDRLGVDNRFQLGLTLGALRAAEPAARPAAAAEEE
ncbi:LuxR C-terminal-related transcriptional regulator [Phytohabitans sp. LJ34]|uniref:LuxR C-terminal-related transcriptional regulator n=1 Tax=Phytohabitans sp. LJ34 TaxID=3452217 RepID=UPI003F8B61F1